MDVEKPISIDMKTLLASIGELTVFNSMLKQQLALAYARIETLEKAVNEQAKSELPA